MEPIPVVLFAYARPAHLRQTLECLRANRVPLIYAFVDAPATPEKAPLVEEVAAMVRGVGWCETVITERTRNLGLGRSILAGVSEVLEKHPAAIVFEDDLVCVPGTYAYLCAALKHYRDDPRAMSVTGWTHPRVLPAGVDEQPYWDGRAECLVWGTWARAWAGMQQQDAMTLMRKCAAQGKDIFRYGADLPEMAQAETTKNIWAVRFLYWHLLHDGLCLRPPHSLVEHIGWDAQATNSVSTGGWENPPLQACPPLPAQWPEPVEAAGCPRLWQRAFPTRPPVVAAPASRRTRVAHMVRKSAVQITGIPRLETISTREFAGLFVPPVAVKAGRRLTAPQPVENGAAQVAAAPEWETIPEGWGYAANHPEIKGWNVQEVLEAAQAKWPAFVRLAQGSGPLGIAHESTLASAADIYSQNTILAFAYTLALAAGGRSQLSMLDWGGGIGHYGVLAQALLPGVAIDYHCKDVPALAEYGARLLPQAHFYSDDACLEQRHDYVIASASLHYAEEWRATLAGLACAARDYLFVTRLPTTLYAPDYVFVQRPYQYGYNTEYLGWCLNRTGFLAEAEMAGLRLVREFVIGEQPPIVNAPGACQYRGFLFRTGKSG